MLPLHPSVAMLRSAPLGWIEGRSPVQWTHLLVLSLPVCPHGWHPSVVPAAQLRLRLRLRVSCCLFSTSLCWSMCVISTFCCFCISSAITLCPGMRSARTSLLPVLASYFTTQHVILLYSSFSSFLPVIASASCCQRPPHSTIVRKERTRTN